MNDRKPNSLAKLGARVGYGSGLVVLIWELLVILKHGLEAIRANAISGLVESAEHAAVPVLLALIVMGLAHFRVHDLEEIVNRQEFLVEMLSTSTARIVVGDEIELSARRTVDSCSSDVLAIHGTDQYAFPPSSGGQPLPDLYFEAIAQRIADMDHRFSRDISYKVVLQKGNKESVKVRYEAFKKYNVLEQLEVKFTDDSWPIEVLATGKSAQVALLGVKHDSTYAMAFDIQHNADAATRVVKWFETHFWERIQERSYSGVELQAFI